VAEAEEAKEVAVRNRKKRKRYKENKKARSIASSLVAQFDRADAAVDKGGNGNNGRDEGTSTPAMKKTTEAHADATPLVLSQGWRIMRGKAWPPSTP
jgi:hypothetical protein